MSEFVRPKTNEELIAEALAIEDYLKAEQKKLQDFLAPYKARSDEIDGILMARMNEQGMNQIKTHSGTAYKSTITTPRIVDRETYLDFVLDNYDTVGRGMLQVGAPKKEAWDDYCKARSDAITEYQQQHGGELPEDMKIYPPGCDANIFTRVNIRRS